MEFSTNKITPNDNVKIPSMNGNNSGHQLDSELREYVQAGVSGVTEQYSNLSTYAYGKRLKHEGVEYRCIVPVETPENFDPDKWVKVDLTELDKRVLENVSAINAIISGTMPVSQTTVYQQDMNTIRTMFAYFVDCTNAPTGYCQGFSFRYGGDGVQLVMGVSSTNPTIYIRATGNGNTGWGAWRAI